MVLWKTKGQYHFSDSFQRCFSGKAAGRKVLAGSAASAPAQWGSRSQRGWGWMESPGWGEWHGSGGSFLKRFQCPVLWRVLGHVAVLEFSTAFPWMVSPIYSHMPQLFPLSAPTLSGGNDIWKHKSRDKLTLQPPSLICSCGGSSGRWIVQGQVPNLKFRGAFLPPLRATFIHTLWKKLFWLYHARTVLPFWFIFWKCGWSPIKMWAKSLHKSTTRGAGSDVNFTARCPNPRQNLPSLRWFKLPFLGDVTRGMPWFAIRSCRFHTGLPSTSSSTSCTSSTRLWECSYKDEV